MVFLNAFGINNISEDDNKKYTLCLIVRKKGHCVKTIGLVNDDEIWEEPII